MTVKRFLLEMGTGFDLHGQDYTRAAKKAVQDAIHRNSMLFIRSLDIKDRSKIHVDITVGIPRPEAVNKKEVLEVLPVGQGRLTVVSGGLEIAPREGAAEKVLMANAAVFVSVDVD